jgi:hypothetical protein
MGWRCGSGEPEGALLSRPLDWQIDIPNEPVRGQFGRLTSRLYCLDNLRRQEGERQQAAYAAIADPLYQPPLTMIDGNPLAGSN